jgi:pimeloyl-ACP methyl ester carboxylesterase
VPAVAQTSSPFTPPEAKLGVYVINSGGGLDTGCTYRSGSPLIVRLRIPASFSEKQLNADGTLKDAAGMVRRGVLGANAVVRFPVFDIDSSASTSGFAPEVDHVRWNGQQKKTLSGFNNTWTDDSLSVPIEELHFASPVSPNAVNELRVDIDQGNVGVGEFWCMAIDWLAVEFEAAAPYAMLHGINDDASCWDDGSSPGVSAAMDSFGVLSRRFQTGKHGAVAANGRDLRDQITAWLETLQIKQVHIIAHSKGGLDAQMMAALAPEFEIMSLSTFSTPHLGSVTADVDAIRRVDADDKVENGSDPNGFVRAYVDSWSVWAATGLGRAPQPPGIDDLTTFAATGALAAGQRGNVARTFSIGASADLNGNGTLESGEIDPFPTVAHDGLRLAWDIMRTIVRVVEVGRRQVPGRLWGVRTVLDYSTTPGGPFANDIVVTVNSANPGYAQAIQRQAGANHATVKSPVLIRRVLETTVRIR